MISGTYVLTDSIDQAFDRIFTDIRQGSNAVISGKSAFDISRRERCHRADARRVAPAEGPGATGCRRGRGQRRLGRDAADRRRREGGRLGRRAEPRLLDRERRLGLQPADAGRGRLAGPERGRGRQGDGGRGGLRGRGDDRRAGRRARPAPAVSGIVQFSSGLTIGGATLAGFDLPTAQRLFKKVGQLDEIAVAAKPDVTGRAAPRARSRRSCRRARRSRPASEQAQSDAEETNEFISFLRSFLLAFGGIALFVGSFVIANSLSITIAQRTREFATLRTLGATNRQVLGSVIVEALVVGIVASVVGLFLGLLLAKGLFQLFDAVGFTLPNTGLVFEPRTIVVALAAGILVTLLASVYPGFRATTVPPIAAVREGAALPGEPLDRDPKHAACRAGRPRVGVSSASSPSRATPGNTLVTDPARGARPAPHPLRLRALPVAHARRARVRRARLRRARLRALRARARHDERASLDGRRRAARVLRRGAGDDAAHPAPLGAHVPDRALVGVRARGARSGRSSRCRTGCSATGRGAPAASARGCSRSSAAR